MHNTLTKRLRAGMALVFAAVIAVTFSCTSVEEQPTLDENALFKKAFLEELENLQFPTDPNARAGNAMPSLQVTLAALRATDNWVPAVKDRATVFIATDEAYKSLEITPRNVNQNLDLVMAAIGNQVISGKKFSGNQLLEIQGEANLLSMIPINPEDLNPIYLDTKLFVLEGGEGKYILKDSFGQTANIIRTDFKATKSVTHFIDKVLFPFPESSEE
ncbi:Fasciclin domain-containing protein [Belliella buryatensis]|uniref:Fasciclin domain-containing protein n=1 Tax=Belliella buryatensis TaxID=1500549 RepID=A0A239C5F0_9BACT|nr:fasciclin domain-containing protein [Belliella buryatensis]SNS14908.1 Fasciclin domain-containing protein [Belliella buryatensis]